MFIIQHIYMILEQIDMSNRCQLDWFLKVNYTISQITQKYFDIYSFNYSLEAQRTSRAYPLEQNSNVIL